MGFQVVLSPKARRDLQEIGSYIGRDNPEAALKQCSDLLQKALSLGSFPFLGSSTDQKDIRHLTYLHYLIFYRLDNAQQQVRILRFWHGARDPDRIRLRETAPVYGENVQGNS